MFLCVNCRREFEPKRSDQKHCSLRCGQDWYEKKKRANKLQLIQETSCEFCGESFKPKTLRGAKFCSVHCKIEWHKAKKRENNRTRLEKDPIPDRKCEFCRKKFVPTRRCNEEQRFCSKRCKTNHHAKSQRIASEKRRKATINTCPICEKQFSPKKTLKEIYCSGRCRRFYNSKIYGALSRCYNYTGIEKREHSHELLGYSPRQLQEYVQSHPNWPLVKDGPWHLDHVFPIIAFVEKGIKDIALMCSLDNLQPLSGKKNCQKNKKYDKEKFEAWLKSKGISWTSL